VLHEDGNVGDAYRSEEAAVAFDLLGGTHGLGEVVGELDGGAAFDFVNFADEAEGVEAGAGLRIASAEIVGQQCAPAGTETNAAAGSPLARLLEVVGIAKIGGGHARF